MSDIVVVFDRKVTVMIFEHYFLDFCYYILTNLCIYYCILKEEMNPSRFRLILIRQDDD